MGRDSSVSRTWSRRGERMPVRITDYDYSDVIEDYFARSATNRESSTAEQLLNNKLQMRGSGANESAVSLTKQMRVISANRSG